MQNFLLEVFIIGLGFVSECNANSPLFGYSTDEDGHVIQTLKKSFEVNLGQDVPFFGRKFMKAYISADGLLGFDVNVRYQEIHYKNGRGDTFQDFPFIGVFHYRGSKRTDDPVHGRVFHRLVKDKASLSQLKLYILNSTVGVSHTFQPDLALEVTWENVMEDECDDKKCPTATFQLLFIASTNYSFAVINYKTIAIPLKPYYQAGFNGGHGLGWKNILPCDPVSCTYTLRDLPRLQGSDVTGRFIFDVGGQQIRRGGCLSKNIEADNLLELSPRFASLLGGEMLNISGTCIPPRVTVRCRFGTGYSAVETPAFRVNYAQARCPVPRLTQRGQTEISLSVDGSSLQSNIFIVEAGRVASSLKLEGGGWPQTDPARLSVSWNPSLITYNNTVRVDVLLIGYRETETEVIWKELKTLGSGIENTGTFKFSPSDHRCRDDECKFEIGVIEVRLRQADWKYSNTHVAVNSGITPIGWFVIDYMTSQYGSNWTDVICQNWYNEDKKDNSWLNDLLPCPTTMDQAISDFGRWQQDDACNIYSNSETNCNLHKPSVHCARSFKPTSKGAGNQCCYGPDSSLLGNKSTADRSHDWGATPYNKPGYVPSASHWIRDIIPVYFCMKWSNNTRKYLELRPLKDTPPYRLPKAGNVSSDSHIRTFDNFEYQFEEEGEFWLYKSEHVNIQGRFKNDTTNASSLVLSGLAMQEGQGQILKIFLAPANLTSRNRLLIFVDDSSKFFDKQPLSKQDFKGVTVISNEDKGNLERHGNFTVIFMSGVGVLVAEQSQRIHIIVNLPPECKNSSNSTGGLLGNWDENKNNDVEESSGNMWAVQKEESLFLKETSLATFYEAHHINTVLIVGVVVAVVVVFGIIAGIVFALRRVRKSDSKTITKREKSVTHGETEVMMVE